MFIDLNRNMCCVLDCINMDRFPTHTRCWCSGCVLIITA